MAQPSSEKYFFGRIAREQAEKVLKDTGLHEGLFLLRESMSVFGNYVLSIVHEGRYVHLDVCVCVRACVRACVCTDKHINNVCLCYMCIHDYA